MNQLKIFENSEFGSIRTLEVEGEPYFVGKDVARNLGYQNGSRDINRHVDEEDRCKAMVFDGTQNKETIVINESGLYSLILSSKLPTAKKFKHWVTSEVLPTIRKTGGYVADDEKFIGTYLPNADEATRLMFKANLEAIRNLNNKVGLLETENAQHKQIIGELKPRADYTDKILNNKSLVTITQIAKDYGMSGKKMNTLLHNLGVQYKQSGQWLLYSKHHEKGFTHSKTIKIIRANGSPDTIMETKWTQKGRLFIYDLLKSNGILPLIEQDAVA